MKSRSGALRAGWEDVRRRLAVNQRLRWFHGGLAKLALAAALGWQLSCWFGLGFFSSLMPALLSLLWSVWDWTRCVPISEVLAVRVLDAISGRGALFETGWELSQRGHERAGELEAQGRRAFESLDLEVLLPRPPWSREAPLFAAAALLLLLSAPPSRELDWGAVGGESAADRSERETGGVYEEASKVESEDLNQSLKLIAWTSAGQMLTSALVEGGQKSSDEARGGAESSPLEGRGAGGPELADPPDQARVEPARGGISAGAAGREQSRGAGRQASSGSGSGMDGSDRGVGIGDSENTGLEGTPVRPEGFNPSAQPNLVVRRQLEGLSLRERQAAARYFGSF